MIIQDLHAEAQWLNVITNMDVPVAESSSDYLKPPSLHWEDKRQVTSSYLIAPQPNSGLAEQVQS